MSPRKSVSSERKPQPRTGRKGLSASASDERTASGEVSFESSREELTGVIARRAYELYENRGRQDGRDFDDWIQAEREVLSNGR